MRRSPLRFTLRILLLAFLIYSGFIIYVRLIERKFVYYPEATFIETPIAPEDWILLCSDGLWNMVNDDQILAEIQKAKNKPTQLVKALIQAANHAGGKDNISVVAIKLV